MSTHSRIPDDSDRPTGPEERELDLFAGRVLGALQAPPMREEFAESLAESLDEKFAEFASGLTRNGHDFLESATSAALDGQPENELAPAPAQPPAASGWKRRLSAVAVMVASLIIAVTIVNSRPNYSWAAVIDAMNSQSWVHAARVQNGVVLLERWRSIHRGVDAKKGDGQVVLMLTDGARPEKLTFNEGEDHVTSEAVDGQENSGDWRRLLPGLLSSATGAATAAAGDADGADQELPPGVPVVESESWRRVTGADGQSLIELTVSLTVDGDLTTWVLIIDPETHLPQSARPAGGSGGEELKFSYPAEGPETIAALGAPESAQVVSLSKADQPTPGEVASADNAAAAAPGGIVLPPIEQPIEPPAAPWDVVPEPIGEPLPDAQLTAQVDELLREHWAEKGVAAAERSGEEEFLRRVYLDLIGRIPTVGEARVFLEDRRAKGDATSAELRAELVDELLASRDHATHFAAIWRRNLIPASVDLSIYGGPERLDQWLADRIQKNLPYDQLAAELLLAEGRISESGPLLFYAALKLNPEEIAAQTSRVFLGTRMECAQCHDHPFDERLGQEDFWGFAALFAQISRPLGMMDTTSPVLRVHDNNRGEVMLPDTETVVPPRLPLSDRPVYSDDAAPSRREQFVNWLVDPHNELFRQATVNRVWAHLFGRGLVDPVDDIREENPAVSPELLELLAEDFARSGFDLRRLLRQLVLSDAYQLTSVSEAADEQAAAAFARMNIKSFTAEQLYDCIAVSTRGAAMARGVAGGGLVRIGDASRNGFIALFEAPGADPLDYHAGIPQALTLMHGGLIHSATDLATSGLLKSLSAPFFTDEQRIETLFLATLTRRPSDDELQAMSQHLATADDSESRQQKLGDVLWALLNTAEFTLNH